MKSPATVPRSAARPCLAGPRDTRRPRSSGPPTGVGILPLLLLPALTLSLSWAPPMKSAGAQTADDELNARSLPLRTALHHDPTLGTSLDRLRDLYREAGRLDELIGMYKDHTARYPADASGATVLVRLLLASGDPEALSNARSAAARFARNAYLRFLLSSILRERQPHEALTHLDEAIELETNPALKGAWIDELLPLAIRLDRRDLAEKHLTTLAGEARTAQQQRDAARRMIEHGFHAPALELLNDPLPAPPEIMVDIQLDAARAEVGLERREDAAERLDQLLLKLTADYWRRGEILRQRLELAVTRPQRDELVAAARRKAAADPDNAAAVLDLAQVLSGLQLRREALDVLTEAGQRLPGSEPIEKRTLDLLDRLRDFHRRERYLAERIQRQPERVDLKLLRVKTLYLLGRTDEALELLTGTTRSMPEDDRATTLLETARFLRRSLMAGPAVELFRRAVELDPARLDVRRELAETYLSLGRRSQVRELFGDLDVKQAALENLLDMVQFLVEQDFLSEAKSVVRQKLEQYPENLDLFVVLIDVERRLGHLVAGQKLIADARPLADTPARYRRWLESAVAFHEDFETDVRFLEEEPSRLEQDTDGSAARRLERRMVLAEVAARGGQEESAKALLQSALEGHDDQKERIEVRRKLVEILVKDVTQAAAAREELSKLIEDDPAHEDHYLARLALMHQRDNRADLAVGLLDRIDIDRIHDVETLAGLRPILEQNPAHRRRILPLLHRLTVLDPGDRMTWKQWLTGLAASGDEIGLRGALRRILAGVDELPIGPETRTLLESHIADSYWRDIGRCLVDQDSAALSSGLHYLEGVESIARDDQQWLWIAWIRAYMLSRLGHEQALREALDELRRMAENVGAGIEFGTEDSTAVETPPTTGDELIDSVVRIAFPDGISISLENARRLLLDATTSSSAEVETPSREGPSPRFDVRWTYDIDPLRAVTSIVPLDASRVLIVDDQGDGHCVDRTSGKLLWRRQIGSEDSAVVSRSAANSTQMQQQLQQLQVAQQSLAALPASRRAAAVAQIRQHWQRLLAPLGSIARPISDGQGRIIVPGNSSVFCHAADDGRILWQAEVGQVGFDAQPTGNPNPGGAAGLPPLTSVFLHDGQLLTYEPTTGTVTGVDTSSGKIVWDRSFSSHEPAAHLVGVHNSGASLSGDRLLIYGVRAAIVDLRSRRVEWSFEPWRVRSFPLSMPDPTVEESDYSFDTRSTTPAPPPTRYASYLESSTEPTLPSGQLSLAAPAVAWAAKLNSGTPREAELVGRHLLLLDESGMRVIDTEVPLSGIRAQETGQLVGIAGRNACLLNDTELRFVDMTDGTVKRFDLEEIAGDAAMPTYVTVDGFWVYATGPGGILGINALRARRAFKEDWPEELKPQPQDELEPSAPAAVTVPSPLPPSIRYAPSVAYSQYGGFVSSYRPVRVNASSSPWPYASVPGIRYPRVNCADRGVLFAVSTPHRVAALGSSDQTASAAPDP